MQGRHPNSRDKTRMCPYCRMEISAFATKCFHCGERVEPQRWDQRHFTMEDLGGARKATYAPPDSVMAALETFRAELEGQRISDGGHGSEPSAPSDEGSSSGGEASDSGLPSLDERSQFLASLHEEARPTGAFARVCARPRPSLARRLGTIAAAIILLAALGLGGFGLYSITFARPGTVPAVPDLPQLPANEALELLKEGQLLDALDAARSAVVVHDTERNRAIQEEVRAAVKAEIHARLNADPWSPEDLEEAVRLAGMATIRDPGPFFTELEAEVKQEEYAYRMMLVRPEPRGRRGRARFRLHRQSEAAQELGEEFVTVGIGEEIAGRFRLIEVQRGRAKVEDLEKGRRLIYSVDGSFIPAE